MHQASIEQYYGHHRDTLLDNLWHDFCQAQWPELYMPEKNRSKGKMKSTTNNPKRPTPDLLWLDSARDGGHSPKFVLHL
jgi:hypothetical protein